MATVLITGASSGIGKALAHVFADHGHTLLMTSANAQNLERAVAEIQADHRDAVLASYVQDLAAMDGPEKLYQQVQADGHQVDILVNDAGTGWRSLFAEMPPAKIDETVHLNIRALVALTRMYLPEMLARKEGKILNLGSIAGFTPGPFMAVYHATKAFVVSFGDSVNEEIKDSGVTLTTLCPGATNTDFFDRANAGDIKGREPELLMEPKEVAEEAYRALMDGHHTVVPGAKNKAIVLSSGVLPRSLQAKMGRKQYENGE